MLRVLYAIVDRNGNIARRSRRGGGLRVYERRKVAERWATKEGDTVVELVWDSEREPLFIKTKKLGDE